ncbi:glycosyltransferase family 52 [uncultured Psychromonas sp.]|uniref:glycosyltransferase family 52 n=1 Tax=uncultured Psychromonas sp. TaxID=173974 RepID=UPI002611A34E|nr:glycosyltransferase family 52 [uncultured Psychromonas sp.]
MDIYLCSTVRHLLFSLLKALSTPDKKSCLLMVTDQQNIDIQNYDLNRLPNFIRVVFIQRSDINKNLLKYKLGKGIKVLANFNIYTSLRMQSYFKKLLFTKLIPIANHIKELEGGDLYLFNDRNKLSRLLRLTSGTYSIIEDGAANYLGTKLKKLEKIGKLITLNQQKKRYFGDDPRCKAIYLLNKDGAPEYLKKKVVQIEFILPHLIKEYCLFFFKEENLNETPYILATQPIIQNDFASSGRDLIVYREIIKYFKSKGINIVIKTHPRESVLKYKNAFPDILIMESKVPLELIIFNGENKCNIISLFSSAGAGFEDYCHRLTLIDDIELENLKSIINSLKEDKKYLEKRIHQRFSYLFNSKQ